MSPEDNAILYLTSGATGEPKMVMVTHGAIVANVHMGPAVLPLTPDDITVAFLPSAHIAQRVVVEMLPILTGTAVSFAESLLKLQPEIKAVRPTWFLAPPRVWERIYTSIRAEILKKPAIAQKAFFAALGLGMGGGEIQARGQEGSAAHSRAAAAWPTELIFSKIRERFGGRLRVAASGAAPLGRIWREFYEAIGMPLIEGYGLTEGGVAAFNPIDAAAARQYRQSSAWRGVPDRRRRRAADPQPVPVRADITRTRQQPPKCCRMAGCIRAISARSMPKATSTSRAGRKN